MRRTTIALCLAAMLGASACHYENFDERCEREAREHTEKQCPRRMDAYTVMDSICYNRETRTLVYYYTLEGMLDNDSVMTAQTCNAFENLLRENVANSVDLKTYKEKRINFSYCYRSRSTGRMRFKVDFTPEDYASSNVRE